MPKSIQGGEEMTEIIQQMKIYKKLLKKWFNAKKYSRDEDMKESIKEMKTYQKVFKK